METNSMNQSMQIKPQLTSGCGIDVHKEKLTVCIYQSGQSETVHDYGTFTEDMEKVRDDLLHHHISEVILESTGIYWIALCSLLLAAGIRVTVVNPRFVKNMPKEKTDKKDARWLCKLLVNGLVRNSFIAGEEQRAFRDLCRMRSQYSNHITQTRNRIVKNLERRNIKLKSVVSNLHTKSAHDIVTAIAHGESDIDQLVSLCRGKLKKKKEQMRKALHGVITSHDRRVLGQLLDDVAHYQNQIERIETQIGEHTNKINQQLIEHLKEVKGVGQQSAEIILAEIGDTVKPFATADKLAAWVGLAPGNKESAGKKYYSGTREGNVYVRTALVQVAWAAVRTRNSYWRALYFHLTKRMPMNKAIVAIARKLLKVIYKIIKGNITYTEYGAEYFLQRLQQRQLQKRNKTIVQA